MSEERILGKIAHSAFWQENANLESSWEHAAQAVADHVRAADAAELFRLNNILQNQANVNIASWDELLKQIHELEEERDQLKHDLELYETFSDKQQHHSASKFKVGDEVFFGREEGGLQKMKIICVHVYETSVSYSTYHSDDIFDECALMTRSEAADWVMKGGKSV